MDENSSFESKDYYSKYKIESFKYLQEISKKIILIQQQFYYLTMIQFIEMKNS